MVKRKVKKLVAVTQVDKLTPGKFFTWSKIVPKSVFPLEKGSRAGVLVDNKGAPKLFVFDTNALLDVLSEVDENLVDRLSAEEYHSKKSNPAGWLIDELESKLPLREKFIQSLRDAIDEAKKRGWIPFSKIEKELELV